MVNQKYIQKLIQGHSAFILRAEESERYYTNDNDIKKTGASIYKNKTEDETNPLKRADNRISHNWHEILVDQKVGYAFTYPPMFDVGNDSDNKRISEILGDKFPVVVKNLGVSASNCGVGWVHYWNGDNAFAAGALHEGPGDGLTRLGRAAVREMESLGMIIDVSHASEKTFWDIVDATERPFIASHSNAYSLCPSRRNLKDGQLKALAERGGVVGMNICGSFIDEKEPSVALLARHADYIANLVGIDHVCCGFDFCGYLDLDGGFDDDTPGIHNHSECQSFIGELEKLGYSQEDIEKVAYKNIFSLMDKLLK